MANPNQWKVGVNGFWHTPADWTATTIPGSTDDVGIFASGTYTITFDPGDSSSGINSLFFNSANATLNLTTGSFLFVATDSLLEAGTINLNESVLAATDQFVGASAAINLTGGALVTSLGIVTDTGSLIQGLGGDSFLVGDLLAGTGDVVAAGGLLDVEMNVPEVGPQFAVSANSASVLLFTGVSIGDNVTFTFQGDAGAFAFDPAEPAGTDHTETFVGMNVGSSSTVPTNFVDLPGSVTVDSGGTGTGASGVVTLSDGNTLDLTGITNGASGWHVLTAADTTIGGTDVFLSMVCYAAGTRILTATGERAIESLLQGDIVLTLSDGELKAQPVKWVGHRRIDLTAHPRPDTVAPIRIERNAIADNMPHTDLLVSPDHAIFVDGKLIAARRLINGSTIRREKGWTSVDYFHVELDAHAILVAEGLPAESYIDTGNRGFFANSGAPLVLHPDLTDETNYPTREAGSCAPLIWDEASVRPLLQQLAERAAAIGRPVPQRVTTTDAGLRLRSPRTGRRTHEPIYSDSNLVIFLVPAQSPQIRLLSRAQSPTEARPWLDDPRQLGVCVKRIVLRGAGQLHEVPIDHPDLTRGWWAIEHDRQMMSRWTDGEAVLPLPAMRGQVMLEIHLAGSMTYIVDAAPEDGTEQRSAA